VLDQKTQEKYLLQHPVSFAHKLYDTYLRSNPYSFDPVWAYVGVLGTIAYNIPDWAVCLYFMLLGAVFVALRKDSIKTDYLKLSNRLYALIFAAVLFLGVNAIIFVTWSRIKVPIIEGIQSRYFIPLAPLLILIFLPIHKNKSTLSKTFYYCVPLVLIVIQLATLAAVYYQFYAPPMPVIGS
jgi:uncharacterized membrane protein